MAKSSGKDKDLVRRVNNFHLLAKYLRDVALRDSPSGSDAAAVRKISSVIGRGRINTSMFGRYVGEVQKEEVKYRTQLSIAEFLMKAEGGRWGPTLDDALFAVYDWIEYGPDGAPANASKDRHRGRPTVAQIQAGDSVRTRGIEQEAPEMSIAEIIESIDILFTTLKWRTEDLEKLVAAHSAVSEQQPEPPCNDRHPLASLLYASMQVSRPTNEADRKEIINAMAEQSGLTTERSRAILCGGHPTDSEVDALASLVNMPPDHLALVIGRFQAASLPSKNGKAVA